MALATKCPHCGTVFKVAADQLKLRGGIVRCGKCGEVFDGNAALVEPEAAAPTPERTAPVPVPVQAENPAEPEEVPVYTVDFDTTYAAKPEPAAEPAPEPEPEPEPEPVPEAEAAAEEPVPQLHIDFDLNLTPPAAPAAPVIPANASAPVIPANASAPVIPANASAPVIPAKAGIHTEPDAEDLLEPEAEEASAPESEEVFEPLAAPFEPEGEPSVLPEVLSPAEEPEPVQSETDGAELVPAAMASETVHAVEPAQAEEDFESEEPGFVTRVRRKEKANRILRVLMALGSIVLLAALLAQGVISFGSVLAARYPETKPALTEACTLLQCQVTLPAQIDALSIETGELQTIGNDLFSLSTTLRNSSNLVQTWPHIELALTDTANKAVVRRVITPQEYLPPRTDLRKGFSSRYEQPVKVYFQLRGVSASGYNIAIFYP